METSEFIEHQPCPCGISSDALAVYTDGHSHCFSCDKTFQKEPQQVKPKVSFNAIQGNCVALEKRKISEKTCRKYGYQVGKQHGKTIQLAPYHNQSGDLVAQKVRGNNKEFWVNGDLKSAGLFGQQLFKQGGKRITVTEGEIDCLSVYECFNWPTVSIKAGAAGATRAVSESIEYLESFEQVIFMFDMDEQGQKALQEINAHERECALRYERIEERLADGSRRFDRLERMLWGVIILIIGTLLVPQFLGG